MWLEIRPNDTLFFRGPEPFNAGESGYVASEFPPTPRTLQGALRAAFLEANGVDMEEYVAGEAHGPLIEALGRANEEMKLDLRGPYLIRGDQPCVPAPLNLVEKDGDVLALTPADAPTATDLGNIRLPSLRGYTSRLEGKWLPLEDLERLLAGEKVAASRLFSPLDAPQESAANVEGFFSEAKVGLARNPASHAAEEGMLYTILTLRAGENTGFAASIEGLSPEALLPEVVKLGGEGRFAWSSEMKAPATGTHREEIASRIEKTHEFQLVFLQPAHFGGGWLPEGFRREESGWRGKLAGIECVLVSAVLDKPRRIGGWDMKMKRPHPLEPHVPAGSVYFFETRATGDEVVKALDDAKLGGHTNMGFGHVLVGGWR
jgi:CRISPR-associated protein Cmr3